jgi:hypothetical protein
MMISSLKPKDRAQVGWCYLHYALTCAMSAQPALFCMAPTPHAGGQSSYWNVVLRDGSEFKFRPLLN